MAEEVIYSKYFTTELLKTVERKKGDTAEAGEF